MKITTFSFVSIAYFLVNVFSATSYAFEPTLDPDKIKRDEEHLVLQKMYMLPMNAISDILEDGLLHCDRLPAEKEFRDFVLKGAGPNIHCTQAINLKPKILLTKDIIFISGAQNKVDLQEFLKNHNIQVYSDSKILYAILKQDQNDWSFKYFKAHEYDLLVHCAYRINQCDLIKLDQRKKSCRNNPSFARSFCYLGDKKVIDYD